MAIRIFNYRLYKEKVLKKIAQPFDTQTAENHLLFLLKAGPKDRKQLVDEFLTGVDLSPEERKDKRPGAALNRAKCTIGIAITNLINMGHLKQDDSMVSIVKSIEEAQNAIKRDPIIRKTILELIGNARYNKGELFNKVVEIYHKEIDRQENVTTIKRDSGRILSDLLKSEEIKQKDGYYILSKGDTLAQSFANLSDEEFVNRSVEMLECWYRKRTPELSVQGANTDGPEDGGIDGNIVVKDDLWGSETVILQMKHINSPKKKTVPLREVQEFCGVLSAEKSAVKGIFLTNVNYNTKTLQFAQKYTHKPLVLINGEKWLELAQSCGYTLPEQE